MFYEPTHFFETTQKQLEFPEQIQFTKYTEKKSFKRLTEFDDTKGENYKIKENQSIDRPNSRLEFDKNLCIRQN